MADAQRGPAAGCGRMRNGIRCMADALHMCAPQAGAAARQTASPPGAWRAPPEGPLVSELQRQLQERTRENASLKVVQRRNARCAASMVTAKVWSTTLPQIWV